MSPELANPVKKQPEGRDTNKVTDQVARLRKLDDSETLSLGVLERVAAEFGINFGIDLQSLKDQHAQMLSGLDKKTSLPFSVRNPSEEVLQIDRAHFLDATAFYAAHIVPMIAKGSDVYKPTDSEIFQLCHQLAKGEPVQLVMYYALSKTRSPKRTGSPDTVIDAAEIEMLKNYSSMVLLSRELGLNFSMVIVDETDALPLGMPLGMSQVDKEINTRLVQDYLRANNVNDRVIIRSLADSVMAPLGADFAPLHAARYEENLTSIRTAILSGEKSAETVRLIVFLDCMPDEGLVSMGVNPEDVASLRTSLQSVEDLGNLPASVLNTLTHLTAHFKATMDLRAEASARVSANNWQDRFPEYDTEKRFYGGITRSKTRWSFIPHPKKNMGRVVNPMHGLALYRENDGHRYLGNTGYQELKALEDEGKNKIIYVGNKPVFSILKI